MNHPTYIARIAKWDNDWNADDDQQEFNTREEAVSWIQRMERYGFRTAWINNERVNQDGKESFA